MHSLPSRSTARVIDWSLSYIVPCTWNETSMELGYSGCTECIVVDRCDSRSLRLYPIYYSSGASIPSFLSYVNKINRVASGSGCNSSRRPISISIIHIHPSNSVCSTRAKIRKRHRGEILTGLIQPALRRGTKTRLALLYQHGTHTDTPRYRLIPEKYPSTLAARMYPC